MAKNRFGNQIDFQRSADFSPLEIFTEHYFTVLLNHTEQLPSSLNAQPIGQSPAATLTIGM